MSQFRHNPLLAFLVHMTQSVILRQIAYLKAENRVLRSRFPKAVHTTPAERSLLGRLGSPLGSAIQEIKYATNRTMRVCGLLICLL